MPAHDREEADQLDRALEVSPQEYAYELSEKPDVALIDVREPHEYEISRIDGSTLIPLGQLPGKLEELDLSKTYVLQCKTGGRSMEATQLLRGAGFRAVNLHGGINQYARDVDPSIPTY